MSKKVNPAAVGLFVSGALVILLAGLVALGSGKFFEKRGRFVVYFQSSANGLEEGSDVQLGGVKVGRVVKMHVQFDPVTRKKVIPVVIELSADRIADLSVDETHTKDEILSDEVIGSFIQHQGLRARLMNKSALTGQLFVDLDFVPESEELAYTFPGETIDGLVQIPTSKNQIERVLESIAEGLDRISKIDVGELVANVDKLLVDLDDKINELDLKGISDKAKTTLQNADAAMLHLDELLSDDQIMSAIANLNDAAAELKELVSAIDAEKVNLAVENAAVAIERSAGAIENIGGAAGNIADLTDQSSVSMVRLNRALSSVEGASRSIKDLADYLKRNPNALLSGKKQP